MGWLKEVVFGAPKVIDTAADLAKEAAAGIDVLFHTDEEKETAKMDWYKMWLRGQEITNEESTERAVTRRKLALMIMQAYLGLVVVSAFLWRVDKEWGKHVFETSKELSYLALLVGFFFFGYYGVQQVIKSKKG